MTTGVHTILFRREAGLFRREAGALRVLGTHAAGPREPRHRTALEP